MAITAVREYRESGPLGWTDYLAQADDLAGADAPIGDQWA